MSFRISNNPNVAEITKSCREREYSLSCLRLPAGAPKACVWCLGRLHGRQRRWCSDECVQAAQAWTYPQKEAGLYVVMTRQEYRCAGCAFDYKPFLEAKARQIGCGLEPFHHWLWAWFKTAIPEGRGPEVDHIIPIYKGGTALGHDNHQVLCYACHKSKTRKDLKKN